MGIFATVSAVISVYTGILTFTAPMADDFKFVYFSDFNINIFDVFIISTLKSFLYNALFHRFYA